VLVNTDQSVRAAGGYLIQLMPGAPEGLIDVLEARIAESPSITGLLETHGDIESAMLWLLDGFGVEILARHPVGYVCKCSEDKVARALRSMGRKELESLIAEAGEARVTCQFCDKEYVFDGAALRQLAEGL
jgi:molecular chaperone Hsp33